MWLRRTSRVGLASGPSVGYSMASRMAASRPSTSLAISPEVAHIPPVGLEALGHVVVVGQLGRPVDGDVVVVVERHQPAQAEVPGQRRRLVRDALHEAAVPGDHEGAVVADVAAEARPHEALGDGHADRVADALAKRPRRHLDTVGVAALGMPRRPASPLTELP